MAIQLYEYTSSDTFDDYTGAKAQSEFGDELDLWGTTFSAAELSDPSFAVTFDAEVGPGILQADLLSVEIFYTLPIGTPPEVSALPHADSGLLACAVGEGPSGERLVVAGIGGKVKVSDDSGDTWVTKDTPTAGTLRGAAYTPAGFVFVGDGGVIISSADGETWAAETSNTAETLHSVAVSKFANKIVTAGANGVVRSKTTGSDWLTNRF